MANIVHIIIMILYNNNNVTFLYSATGNHSTIVNYYNIMVRTLSGRARENRDVENKNKNKNRPVCMEYNIYYTLRGLVYTTTAPDT